MIHFIVNPNSRSGQGLLQWKALKPQLDAVQLPYSIYFTKNYEETKAYVAGITASPLPAEAPAAPAASDSGEMQSDPEDKAPSSASSRSIHRLVIIGGDGTVNEVANGIADRRNTHITYLPTGSGNDLFRSIKKDSYKRTPLDRILSPAAPVTYDLGRVSAIDSDGKPFERYFTISSGIGFDAAACAASDKRNGVKKFLNKLHLGKLTYVVNALISLSHMPLASFHTVLNQESSVSVEKVLFSVAMIHRYEGGGMPFCPNADPADGLLDLCQVSSIRKWQVLYLLPMAVFGKHIYSRHISCYRTRALTLKASTPLPVHTDGEVLGEFTDIQVEIPVDASITFV